MKPILLLSLLLALRCYAPSPLFLLQNGASAAPFSPDSISGLTLWLVADDISGSDGDLVASWPARSPTTISASQGTLAARPTLQVAEVNGRNAVQGDGVNDRLTLSSPVSSVASWTVIVVQKRSASSSLAFALGNSFVTPLPPYSPFEYGTLSRLYFGSRTDQKFASIPSHAFHVLTGQDDAGTLRVWVDSVSQSLTAAASTGSADFDQLFNRSSEYSAIFVSELLFYNRTLTTTEREAVEAYLKTRYSTP